MAQIVINEISQNYTYNIGTNSYATVALPITSCWGPGYFDPGAEYAAETAASDGDKIQQMLEHTVWQRFPATQSGLEAFVATYRGAASGYRLIKDFSYQMAMTLLTSGYDVLVCRLCPGTRAFAPFVQRPMSGGSFGARLQVTAKYPGSFGNNLQVDIQAKSYFDRDNGDRNNNYQRPYWAVTTYVLDPSGTRTCVENKSIVFHAENATDTIEYYEDADSAFWTIRVTAGEVSESYDNSGAVYPIWGNYNPTDPSQNSRSARLLYGADYDTFRGATRETFMNKFQTIAERRYSWAAQYTSAASSSNPYSTYPAKIEELSTAVGSKIPVDRLAALYYREWVLSSLVGTSGTDSSGDPVGGVFDLLKDKLTYNPNRVISPGWDDQDYFMYESDVAALADVLDTPNDTTCSLPISPLHLKIMDVAYFSRCATGFIDTPRVLSKKFVHIEDEAHPDRVGYMQKLARLVPKNAALDTNGVLFHTHCAFFAPWGQYQYVGTGKMEMASPSFLVLMIQRAQILNQAVQYEWALPTNRKHKLRIGKLDYVVTKKVLDKWQKLDGASVNVITSIPDLGVNLWGNSTLFEVPPVTYQALANLSTRYLVNAVEDCAYRCGISITFQYNNDQAYNKFYAGVTPLLDTMKNVGAIEDYYVRMAADINGLDHVNANTVIGKIYLVVNGVINDIIVDLVALPPSVDLDAYRS